MVMSEATSVIIPCYNGEKYLAEALESVRAQTASVREIILVDDGSDVPLAAPVDWAGPPLRIIRTANQGLAAARNVALRHATGPFVALLDADDLWHPRKIQQQEAALAAAPGAVASFTRCVEASGFFGFGPYPPPDVSDDEFQLMLWYHNFFPPSSVMIRREALTAAGPFREDLGNGEDIELWFRLLRLGPFVQVPEPLCFYRQHSGQFTKNVYRKMIGGKNARGAMIAQHAETLVHAGLPRDRLWDSYRNDLFLLYYRRQFPEARWLLWDFWKDHPGDLRSLAYVVASLLPGLLRRIRGKLSTPSNGAVRAINAAAWKKAVQSIPRVSLRTGQGA